MRKASGFRKNILQVAAPPLIRHSLRERLVRGDGKPAAFRTEKQLSRIEVVGHQIPLARETLVDSYREVINYSGSEKRSVAINDC